MKRNRWNLKRKEKKTRQNVGGWVYTGECMDEANGLCGRRIC
jgi:hypothetical protein